MTVTRSSVAARTRSAAATGHKWTVIDMAADWSVVYPPAS